MKTGYHYTSWTNWLNIQREGFVPYVINKPELQIYFPDQTIRGIWTWLDKPQGRSELGSIIFQISTKAETKVVCLEFDYEELDLLYFEQRRVVLNHDGVVGTWMYHDKEPAVIVMNKIAPEDIRLVKVFDLMDVVQESSRV